MKTLELTVKAVISVSDEVAKRFVESPTGYLMIGGDFLGSEVLKVGILNGPQVEPIHLETVIQEIVTTA